MGGVVDRDDEIARLRERVAALNGELLVAAQVVMTTGGSRGAVESVVVASQRFVAEHRKLWALENPDVDYDTVFGGVLEGSVLGSKAEP